MVSDSERKDQEPISKEPEQGTEATKPRRAFAAVRRELTEEELSAPAVHRLLLDNIDQLEQQVVELSDFRDRFHKVDKEKAVLEQKGKTSTALEIVSIICFLVGAALIGLIPSVKEYAWIAAIIGVILIIGGIFAKMAQK